MNYSDLNEPTQEMVEDILADMRDDADKMQCGDITLQQFTDALRAYASDIDAYARAERI